jgi:hypothetical protein
MKACGLSIASVCLFGVFFGPADQIAMDVDHVALSLWKTERG